MTDNVSFDKTFIKTLAISSRQEISYGYACANAGAINMAVTILIEGRYQVVSQE